MSENVAIAGLAALLVACSGSPEAPDGGDAAGPRDAGRRDAGSPLPTAAELLDPGLYDCRTASVEPPVRPSSPGCLFDPACSGRWIAAHRMGRPFAPENSLSALRASILLGVDLVETDIRLTSDGEVVLIHDGDVDRTLLGTGAVDSMTLAQLQALPMRIDSNLPPGDFDCDRTVTLDGVFAIARGRIVVELEVKETAAGVAAAIYLRDNDLFADAFLLCDPGECAAARAMVPDVPIMTRPQTPEEVATEIVYDPAPALVHIDVTDPFLEPPILDSIRGVGAKVYGNAFTNGDALALIGNDTSAYLETFDRGIDVLQCEYPHWALLALGRIERP